MPIGHGQKCNCSLREVLHFQYFLSSHLSIRFNQFLHIPNLPLRPKLLDQHWTTSTKLATTPAVQPKGWTLLSFVGPCLSAASCSAKIKGLIVAAVSPGLMVCRAVQPTPEKRRAVSERSEFARRRGRRTAQGTRRATPQPKWFWLLLPKQKWLGRRGENRQRQKTIETGTVVSRLNVPRASH